MDLRVLTWNVAGGRAAPSAGRGVAGARRDPYAEFAAALDGWAWDVALLQEVPSWWPDRLRATLVCEARQVLTSRSALLSLRRVLALRGPDMMGAAAGGANAILARSDRIIGENSLLLGRRPERRLVHGVALACGVWISNLRVSDGPAAADDLRAAVRASTRWARAARLPLILGGDLALESPAGEGLQIVASAGMQHVLCDAGIGARAESIARPEHDALAGHPPLAVTLVI